MAAAILLVAAVVIVRAVLDSSFLEEVLNDALIPASGGIYRVEVGGLSYSLLGGDISVTDIAVVPISETMERLAVEGRTPPVQFNATLEEVSIRDVAVWRLLTRRELVAGEFAVSRPNVEFTLIKRSPDDARAEADSSFLGVASTPNDSTPGLPTWKDLRYTEIRRVRIADVNANLVVVGPKGVKRNEVNLTNRLVGLSLNAENLVIDPSKPLILRRGSFTDDTSIDFENLRLELPDELVLEVGPLSSSTRHQSVQIGEVKIVPTYSESEYLEGSGPLGDRIELSAGPIALDGIDFRQALTALSFRASRAHIDRFSIDVVSDRHRQRPESAAPSGPAPTPHDLFQALPVLVTVDTVELDGGTIKYTERSKEAQTPGSITITEIDAVATGLSNDRLVAGPDRPTQISARGKLFGRAEARVDIELPLLAPAPTMNLQARVGPFDPTEVNTILPALEGLRVTEGEVDSAWFDIKYGQREATGSVVAIYRGLDVRMEGRDSGKQDFVDKLGSIAADIGMYDSNEPKSGKIPRAGKVEYQISLEKPFFGTFWEAIRDGLLDLVTRL